MKSWHEYDLALRKWDTKGDTKIPLLVAAAGISGEVGELMEELERLQNTDGQSVDDVVLEMGDVLWYVRAVGSIVGFSMTYLVANSYVRAPFFSLDNAALRIGIQQGRIIDVLKKSTWHGKGLEGLDDHLLMLVGELLQIADALGVDLLTEVAAANVAKLECRYPGGFVEGGGIR